MYFFKQIFRQMRDFLQYMVVVSLQRFGHIAQDGGGGQKLKVGTGIHKILVVRLDEIGDMVLLSPFLRELRRNYPTSHITLVVKSEVYNLVERCPYVNQVRGFSRVRGRGAFYRNLWRAFVFSHKYFREENYDLAFVPRFDADYAYGAGILAFFSKAKVRVGYSEQVLSHKVISDRGYDGFYTDVLLPKTVVASHEVERNLDMLRHIGANIADDSLEVWLDDGDRRKCQDLLHTGSEKMAKIAVSISSGSSRREWPVENFIELISDISHDKSVEWMIIGAGERALRDVCRLEAECPFVINLVNQTSLRETVAAIDVCDIYLGGDTGLMHIAAALDKTGVVISCHPIGADEDHANSPKRFGPWRSSMRVIQPNALPGCEHGCTMPEAHCIREIRVEEVKKQLLLILVDEDHRLS